MLNIAWFMLILEPEIINLMVYKNYKNKIYTSFLFIFLLNLKLKLEFIRILNMMYNK